jgi:hypothetical protein
MGAADRKHKRGLRSPAARESTQPPLSDAGRPSEPRYSHHVLLSLITAQELLDLSETNQVHGVAVLIPAWIAARTYQAETLRAD